MSRFRHRRRRGRHFTCLRCGKPTVTAKGARITRKTNQIVKAAARHDGARTGPVR